MDKRSVAQVQTDGMTAGAVIALLSSIVDPLRHALPGHTEVVLHDLSRLPESVVAISGDVTGRVVGSPATDKLLSQHAAGDIHTVLGYHTQMPGGRELRSSTILVRDGSGESVAALCVNIDVTAWRAVQAQAEVMLGSEDRPEENRAADDETFVRDIDELAHQVLAQAIANSKAPFELMQKRHKVAIVEDLRDRGFFTLKESVGHAAEALGVSRFTIYNYLNELEATGHVDDDT